jgi:hypothetical protein
MSGRKGCLPSILTGALLLAALLGVAWLLGQAGGFVGDAGYALWGVLWAPLFALIPLFHGSFDSPTLPAIILTVVCDWVAFSALAFILYWGRRG